MDAKTSPHRRFAARASLLAVIAACAAPPKAAPPPLLLVESETFAGTVLSGPLVERTPEKVNWEEAWALEATIRYLDTPPASGRPAHGRLVVVAGAEAVFGMRSELAGDVYTGVSEAPEAEARWEDHTIHALPPGGTVSLAGEPNLDLREPPRTSWKRWTIEVSRSVETPGRVEAALVLEGSITPRVDPDEGEQEKREPRASIDVTERLVLDAGPAPGGEPLRLLFPAPLREAPWGAFLVEARLVADPEEAFGSEVFAEALEGSRNRLADAHARASARRASFQEGEGFRFESDRALSALRQRELERPAFVFLAQSTGATITEELALVARPETMGELLTELGLYGADLPEAPEGARSFGWFLERSTLLWLADRSEDEERELEPELFGLLLRHVGELTRYPDLVREGVRRANDSDELAREIVRVNRIFLEDGHPAGRVRAFDWLANQGAEPPDFDPLGPLDERRDALARFEEALEAASAEGEEQTP